MNSPVTKTSRFVASRCGAGNAALADTGTICLAGAAGILRSSASGLDAYQPLVIAGCGASRMLLLFARLQGTDIPPDLRAEHGPDKLMRLIGDAGPEEYFIGAVALLRGNRLPQRLGFRRFPDLEEALFAKIAERRVALANAHIAI